MTVNMIWHRKMNSLGLWLIVMKTMIVMGRMRRDACDPLCPLPCRPSVTQESESIAIVDWKSLWPNLSINCVKEVIVTANGE